MSVEDLAESIARQSRELWGHLPPELVPDEDATIGIKTDADGRLVVVFDGRVFYLIEGRVWSWEDGPAVGRQLVEYENGAVVATGLVTKPPDLN